MNELRGTGVALVTPFNEDFSIDYEGYLKLLQYTESADYWTVQGTTGESPTTTAKEKQALLEFTLANNPLQKPVVFGLGGNDTMALLASLDEYNLDGVTAILSSSPSYNKPSQQGIIKHYQLFADRSPIPIILYNVPGRTSSNILASTTLELAKHPNIIGIKEASGDLAQCKEIAEKKPSDFLLISGDDMVTVPLIEMGGVGLISVLANGFPVEFTTLVQEALLGKTDSAQQTVERFHEINPLMYAQSNPVGVKALLHHMGICGDQVRLPLVRVSDDLRTRIHQAYAAF